MKHSSKPHRFHKCNLVPFLFLNYCFIYRISYITNLSITKATGVSFIYLFIFKLGKHLSFKVQTSFMCFANREAHHTIDRNKSLY